jgi:hypothetical protein
MDSRGSGRLEPKSIPSFSASTFHSRNYAASGAPSLFNKQNPRALSSLPSPFIERPVGGITVSIKFLPVGFWLTNMGDSCISASLHLDIRR